MNKRVLKAYYYLAKPGIVYANVLTAVAGYLYGSAWHIKLDEFAGVVIGIALVIGGACAYNNILDRNFDKQMKRTKNRALVTGEISPLAAGIFASLLVSLGFGLLARFTNPTVVIIGLIGIIDYVILYGWAKRHTPFSTIIGSVSGSTSIVAGYCAATGRFDVDAFLLFLILTLWQMPHFYAIAMYRKQDYTDIKVPLMPLLRSAATAKARIISYIVAMLAASILLTVWGSANLVCLAILVVLSLWWLYIGIKNYSMDVVPWGKKMFFFSLTVNLGISVAVAIGSIRL
jgi:protoheme IX farnesyltransferase